MPRQVRACRLCIRADMPPTVCSSTVRPQLPPVASAPRLPPPWTTDRRHPPKTCLPCPVSRHPAGAEHRAQHQLSSAGTPCIVCLQPDVQNVVHSISTWTAGSTCMASAAQSWQPHMARGAGDTPPKVAQGSTHPESFPHLLLTGGGGGGGGACSQQAAVRSVQQMQSARFIAPPQQRTGRPQGESCPGAGSPARRGPCAQSAGPPSEQMRPARCWPAGGCRTASTASTASAEGGWQWAVTSKRERLWPGCRPQQADTWGPACPRPLLSAA